MYLLSAETSGHAGTPLLALNKNYRGLQPTLIRASTQKVSEKH
jgi:hypothetical protein